MIASTQINDLLDRYGFLLSEVDAWFRTCSSNYPDQIVCHSGCSYCCRGLFDITLLDAFYLKRGVDKLCDSLRTSLIHTANDRLNSLSLEFPSFTEPWLLNVMPEEQWDALMPEEDETPCPLLSEAGQCLLYEYRPMTCRLNGIPLIDVSGEELFDEWCSLNFVEKDPRRLSALRFGFTDLFAQELLLFRELTRNLNGSPLNEVDLFIPAAIVLDPKKILPVIKSLGQG